MRLIGSGPKLSSCGQRRLWSDWADAQADLSLRWAHNHIVGFVMRRLIYSVVSTNLRVTFRMFIIIYNIYQTQNLVVVNNSEKTLATIVSGF